MCSFKRSFTEKYNNSSLSKDNLYSTVRLKSNSTDLKMKFFCKFKIKKMAYQSFLIP